MVSPSPMQPARPPDWSRGRARCWSSRVAASSRAFRGPARRPCPRRPRRTACRRQAATTVSMRFSTSQTRRTISSTRSTGTLISTIADISFSFRMSSRKVPVATSLISDVIGFFFSKATPASASAQHIELNLTHPDADTGTAELDREAGFAGLDAAADVVGLHLFGTAPFDARRFVRHARDRRTPAARRAAR